MQNSKFLILFLFFFQLILGQEVTTKNLKGKVIANYSDLEGIYIVNLKTDVATLTVKGGYFNINASVGDTLMFSAVQFVGAKIILKDQDFTSSALFFVKLETAINVLDEVKIIQYKNINAISLGIIPASTKQYTPAERKLRTATTGGGILPIDPILNWISGRTEMLKKEVAVEKKEFLLVRISDLFKETHFTDVLKIPLENVKGFQYYIVEDEKFVKALNAKNETMATFIMGELAVKYLEIIKQ